MTIAWCAPTGDSGGTPTVGHTTGYYGGTPIYVYAGTLDGSATTWHSSWNAYFGDTDAPIVTAQPGGRLRIDAFNKTGPQTTRNSAGKLTIWADGHYERLFIDTNYGVEISELVPESGGGGGAADGAGESIAWCLPVKSAPPTGVATVGNEAIINIDQPLWFDRFSLYAAAVHGADVHWDWVFVPLSEWDTRAPQVSYPAPGVVEIQPYVSDGYGGYNSADMGTLVLTSPGIAQTLTFTLMYGMGAYGDLVLTSDGVPVGGALPEVLAPIDNPFRAPGHGFADDAVFADVALATGHGRKRRLYTTAERAVDVSWLLGAQQTALVDTWFEDALGAGSGYFSIQVQGQDSLDLLWWKAKWITPLTYEPRDGDVWLVSGRLKLFGTGSTTAPAATPLGCAMRLPLYGASALIVSAPLGCEIYVPLTGLESLGALNIPVALL